MPDKPQAQPLAWRILCALAEDAAEQKDRLRSPATTTFDTLAGATAGMPLPRLAKRLNQSASVLVRELTHLSDATVAGQRGPGWVRVVQSEGRWVVHITAEGLALAQEWAAEGGTQGRG